MKSLHRSLAAFVFAAIFAASMMGPIHGGYAAEQADPTTPAASSATVPPADAEQAEIQLDEKATKDLSLEPLDKYVYPANRPEWISRTPELDGKVHRWPVFSVPSISPEQAHEDLIIQAQAAVRQYVRSQWGPEYESAVDDLQLTEKFLNDHLVDSSLHYQGTVETEERTWHEEAFELKFTPDFKKVVEKQRVSAIVTERMRGLTGLAFLAFASFASLSAILRIAHGRKSQ
jgi:hypothetical protein